jgi:hypothetical protein
MLACSVPKDYCKAKRYGCAVLPQPGGTPNLTRVRLPRRVCRSERNAANAQLRHDERGDGCGEWGVKWLCLMVGAGETFLWKCNSQKMLPTV